MTGGRWPQTNAHILAAGFAGGLQKQGHNNPRTTPPRLVNGPSLLTGIAVCASCGAGMTRTGTNRRGKSYSYYSCAGCQHKGKSVCQGRHIPTAILDSVILSNLKERLLTPDRLAQLLQTLADRQAAKTEAVDRRLLSLQREVTDCDERLRRLYRSIEDGVVELDDILRERSATLKSERERAKAALDRARAQCGTVTTIDSAKIDAFARLMTEKLDTGDTNARRSYIRSIIDAIEVDDKPSGLLAARTCCRLSLPANRPRTGMFVVLYAIGAPGEIRTPDPQIRSLVPRDCNAEQNRDLIWG
jgi:site-specific DNA recombinase